MELSVLDMYWLVKLDDIRGFLFGSGVLFAGVSLFGIIMLLACWADSALRIKYKYAFISVISLFCISLSCILVEALIPSTKQMAAIVVLPKIVNNAQVQALPNKLLDLSTAWLEELKPKEVK